ncbi:hypothetical protein DACRYDRAFT_24285 [Dacryopinax primogenitus]|uniref:Cryptic loci regulator 2 N-terminal domain-containing protein n=1 Tax=Dacryopinax primogenitus (strain DJM 731) TaxID=1858805 RepID=M5FSB6_DACPD|nr:uncharacterized protein DACRYDRAFT_24285 [Dacryopinax primogenitus]EJT98703.1 hypothetical protein DACRYDRAFT_24285 [Dacryopinax primogenitus]
MDPETAPDPVLHPNGQNGHLDPPADTQPPSSSKGSNLYEAFMAFSAEEEDGAVDSAEVSPSDALEEIEDQVQEVAESVEGAVQNVVDDLDDLFGEDELGDDGKEVVDQGETEPEVDEDVQKVNFPPEDGEQPVAADVVDADETDELEESAVDVQVEEGEEGAVTVSTDVEHAIDDAVGGDDDEVEPIEPPATEPDVEQAIDHDIGGDDDEVEPIESPATEPEVAEAEAKEVDAAMEDDQLDIVEDDTVEGVAVEAVEVSEPVEEEVDAEEVVETVEGMELELAESAAEQSEPIAAEDGAVPEHAETALAHDTTGPEPEVQVTEEVEAVQEHPAADEEDVSMNVDAGPAGGETELVGDDSEIAEKVEGADGEEVDQLMEEAEQVEEAEIQYDMPDEDGEMRFPRSDGQSDRLPGSKKGPPMLDRMEVVPRNSETQKTYLKKIGQGVAEKLMGLTDQKYRFNDLPKNYRLYQQHRSGGTANARPDMYLYGSKTVLKFRSTTQFIPHAIWLLTDPTLNNKNCYCSHCSSRPHSEAYVEIQTPERSLKRKSSTLKPESAVKKIKLPDTPIPRDSNSVRPKAVRADRETELASADRLEAPRSGEIIWVHVEPPITGKKPGEVIEFWPCLVIKYEPKRKFLPTENNGTGVAAPAWEVQALGTVKNAYARAESILPYQSYDFPQTTKDVLLDFRSTSTDFDDFMWFNPFEDPPKEKPCTLNKRRSLPDLRTHSNKARTFKNAAPALVLALQMCARLGNGWTTTDAYAHPVPAQNVENPPPISTQNPSRRFEGVFWGAERIWEGDFVRLNIQFKSDLPEKDYRKHLLNNMSEGADGRGLFMHVNAFHFLHYEADTQNSSEKKECWMAGPVFETIFDGEADPAILSGENNAPLPEPSPAFDLVRDTPVLSASALGILAERKDTSDVPAGVPTQYPWPPAPSGFKFRPLLAKDEELYINISCLAGRYYPTIFFKQLLVGRHDLTKTSNGISTPQLLSMAGFMPGYVYAALCEKYNHDRSAMVVSAEEESKEVLSAIWSGDNA